MRFLRPAAITVGVLTALAALTGVVAHFTGVLSTTATLIASFTPLLVLLAVPAVVLLLCSGQRLLALVAAVVLAVGVATQVPLFRGSAAGATDDQGVQVRLMQANIRLGVADPRTLVRTVADQHVDILTVIELTPAAVQRLAAAGLEELLPYSFLRPRDGGGGAGIFSRFPLSDGRQLDGFELHNIKAVAAIPGAGPTAVYALHPLPPYPEPSWKWAYELRRLRAVFEAETLPLVVGADFNSTYDHRQYRDLLRNSSAGGGNPLLDAAEFLGAGIVVTYPADRWYPPVLAIDKILTRGGIPVSLHRIDLPGSDHHGVLGDIRLGAQ